MNEESIAQADQRSAERWLSAMMRGEYEQAWRESDAIRGRGGADPHRFWRGEEIDGRRVMLRSLHGFGDAVQMLRYAPGLKERAAKLTVEVAPRLVELAACFDGVDEVITWGEGAPAQPPEWEVQMEVMELPYLFRTRVEELPIATRYLHLPPVSGWPPKQDAAAPLQIGVAWTSGSWNASRSVPFQLLLPLLQTPGCVFWNLQQSGGAQEEDTASLRMAPGCGESVLRLAQVIGGLDLVITPDTLSAHLAGALGTPAWVMLGRSADWRWLTEREDTPWYPSLRLFRQEREGDWAGVVERMQARLAGMLSSREKTRLVPSS